ncbi:ARC6 IMS domain-containing protein [Pseudoscourfieldia marina]
MSVRVRCSAAPSLKKSLVGLGERAVGGFVWRSPLLVLASRRNRNRNVAVCFWGVLNGGGSSGRSRSGFSSRLRKKIALPVDYYLLLGLNPPPASSSPGDSSFAELVQKAYAQLVDDAASPSTSGAASVAEDDADAADDDNDNTTTDDDDASSPAEIVGFSEHAVAFRNALLKQARDTLLDEELREAYLAAVKARQEDERSTTGNDDRDQQTTTSTTTGGVLLDVNWDDVPGALCALQEVGCMDDVQTHGRAYLYGAPGLEPAAKSDPGRRDAALALALVYCERSRDSLQATPPRVADGCRKLEEALRVLQEEGGDDLAPALQLQVYELLNRNLVRYVLELLALPLDDSHQRERREGLRSLRRVVWGTGLDFANAAKPEQGPNARLVDFLRAASKHMTTYELMALYSEASESRPLPRQLSVIFARAYLARGWVDRRPSLIREAMELCAVAGDDDTGAAIGRATAALLLGQPEDALERLKGAELSVRRVLRQADANAGDEGALQAVCALCQGHLMRDVLPAFRDTFYATQMVNSRGDDADEEGGESRPVAATRAVPEEDSRLEEGGLVPPGSLDDWFADPHVRWFCRREEDVVLPIPARLSRLLGDSVSMPRAAYRAIVSGSDDATQRYLAAGTPAPPDAREDAAAAAAAVAPDAPAPADEMRARALGQAMLLVGAAVLAGLKFDVVPRAMQFMDEVTRKPGTSSTWRSATASQNAARAELSVKGRSEQAKQATTEKSVKGRSEQAKQAETEKSVKGRSEQAKQATLTKMQAHEVIESWQKIKNEALGPKHSIARLDEILEGPMKEHWRARAKHVRNMGWRWDYSLLSLTIEGVELNSKFDRAVVLASIDESAVLREGAAPKTNGRQSDERADSYNSSYRVRYELLRTKGKWKICGGRVLY